MKPHVLISSIVALLAAQSLHAQTWDGGGVNDNLGNAVNWNPDGVPGINADVVFGGVVRLTPNVSNPFQVNSLTFNNTAGAFVFGGGSTLSIKAGGLVNNDTQTQTFNNPVSFGLAATSTIVAAAGSLALNGAVTLPSATLTLDGPNAISFGGPILGPDVLTKNGTGAFNFEATATAIGADFNLNAGTTTLVATGTTQTFNSTSTIAVGGTSAFHINENLTLNGAQLTRGNTAQLVVAAGKTLTVQNGGSVTNAGPVGLTTGSIVTVTGAGSAFTSASTLTISGGSTMNALAGASVSSASAINIGQTTNGLLTVDGAGSSFGNTAPNTVSIGSFGATGNLTFSNGSSGSLGQIHVGFASTGALTLLSGATVTGVSLKVASNAPTGSGAVTISGTGSTLTINSSAPNVIGGGSGTSGTLNVQNGAVFNSGAFDTTIDETGVVTVAGGTFNADGNVSVLGGGQLSVTGTGSFTLASGKTLSVLGGSDASFSGNLNLSPSRALTVDGVGSTVGAQSLSIGTGTVVNLTNGAALTTGAGATFLQSGGTLNITESTVNFGGPLLGTGGVLSFNSGSLAIVDNFTVGTGGLLGTTFTADATRHFTTTGTTTIDPFRTLTINGGRFATGAFVNNGTINFNSGTLAITGAAGFNIGTGALGSAVVLTPGSKLEVTNTLTVAAGASFTLNGGSFTGAIVSNFGSVRLNSGAFSTTGGWTNQTGATLFVSDFLTIGSTITNQAGARITLRDGTGHITAGGILTSLQNSGLITGDGIISKTTVNLASGEIRAEAGKTLVFNGTVGPNAGVYSLQGGALEFAQPIVNNATGFISGHGALITVGLTNNGQMAFSGGNTDIRGDVTLTAGARVVTSGAGAVTTFFDDVVHNGLEIFTGANASTVFFGAQSGAGSFTGTGTVYFIGDLRPGNSPASVLFEGDLVLGGSSSLTLELGGLGLGSQYDHLNVGGSLHADGNLVLALLGGFTPQFGDTFDLLDAGSFSGNFDSIIAPALGGGNQWDFSALKTNGTVTVVPEPGVVTLLASGLGFFVRRPRRNATLQSGRIASARSAMH